jgi:hypothetical protein
MANERVSQLNELAAGEIAADDVFLVTDTSARESKKFKAESLVSYVISSASFSAATAVLADTASYIDPNTVGLIPSSSYSISSSYALTAGNSNTSTTASHALTAASVEGTITNANSASFLLYSGTPNGTASNARTSSYSLTALRSAFLVYSGVNNGTASFSLTSSWTNAGSASHALMTDTASYIDAAVAQVNSASYSTTSSYSEYSNESSESMYSSTASYLMNYPGVDNGTASYSDRGRLADSASYVDKDSPTAVKSWAQVFWTTGYAAPQITASYNLTSITFLDRYATGNEDIYIYGLIFDSPMPSSNYMLLGNGNKFYGTTRESVSLMLFPENANRTTTTCTMSLMVPSGDVWFTATAGTAIVGGATYTAQTASIMFTIFGV